MFILIFSIILYVNTLKNGFVYDDNTSIVKNQLINNLHNIPKLIDKHDYFRLSGEESYRPAVTFSYFMDYAIYGLKPWGYHLTNLLLHAANGALLYIFLTLLIQPKTAGTRQPKVISIFTNQALLISLLFLTHPVLTEAVNAISFREDLMVLLFYIGAFTLYLFLRSGSCQTLSAGLIYICSCLLYLLALLSKEMAITLPLTVYCYDWIYADKERRHRLLPSHYNIGYIAVTFLYLYLRFYRFYNPVGGNMASWGSLDWICTVPYLLLNYIRLCLFPASLSADYLFFPIKSIFSIFFLFSIVSAVILITIVFMAKKGMKEVAFGILFFVIALLPVYNIIPIAHPLAERYLYLPIIGFAIVGGSIISFKIKAPEPMAKLWTIAFLSVLLIYSSIVLKRNGVWKDDLSLWSDTVRKVPNSSRAHFAVGIVYEKEGRLEASLNEYLASLSLSGHVEEANNIGNVYAKLGRLEDAVREYQAVLKQRPNNADAHNNMGNVYTKQGEFEKAVNEYYIAIGLSPENSMYRYNLGFAYSEQGRTDEAMRQYQAALYLDPDNLDVRRNLGLVYVKQGRFNEAGEEFQTIVKQDPLDSLSHYNLGLIYANQDRMDEAIKEFLYAVKLNPKFVKAHYNLGQVYLSKGLKNQARIELEETLKLDPDFMPARQVLEALVR